MDRPEERIASVAARQHGAFSLDQARAAGFRTGQVDHRVLRGAWVRLGRGVLAVAGAPDSWERSAIVPLLARPDALLAERSAAHLHGLLDAPMRRPIVAVPRHTSARVTGASVTHRWIVPAEDRTAVDGLAVTTVARTLVDLAGRIPTRTLTEAMDTAFHQRLATPDELEALRSRVRAHSPSAAAALGSAAEPWRGIRPGSAGEARLLRLIASWGLPEPQRQVQVLDERGVVIARLDVAWPSRRVGLEYDGAQSHGPSRWSHDEERHRRIVELGWHLLRVGARDLLPTSRLRDDLTATLHAAA